MGDEREFLLLREHIHDLLYDYALKHLTIDYLAYTQYAVEQVHLIYAV